MIVTSSELLTFMRCRRKWDYSSHNRQSLVKLGIPAVHFYLGTLVHHGLALLCQGLEGAEWVKGFDTYVSDTRDKQEQEYVEIVGVGWSPEERQSFENVEDEARTLLLAYLDRWGPDFLPERYNFIPECTEVTFQVPLPGTDGEVAGTFDALVIHDRSKGVWIMDHKTYKHAAKLDELYTNFQFMTYMWALRELIGDRVRGLLYDGISKKTPTVPSILKDGTVSIAKIQTTERTYIDVLAEADEDPYDERYASTLKHIRSGDWFHTRHWIRVNHQALDAHEKNMVALYQDMTRIQHEEQRDFLAAKAQLYPNFRWEGCWDCGYKDLCHAQHFDEDVKYLMTQYTKGTYGTVENLGLQAETVTNITELIGGA